MTAIDDVIQSIDWPLLRAQKLQCIQTANSTLDKDEEDLLGGVINTLDAIQDAAEADGVASSEEIFG